MRFRVLLFLAIFSIIALPSSIFAQTLSGSILDTSDNPVGGAVRLFNAGGEPVGDYWTNEMGNFQTNLLDNGVYYAITIHTYGVLDEAWYDLPCVNQICDVTTSTQIVMSGSDIPDIDFVLDLITSGGHIIGLVEDSVHTPLANVAVEIRNSAGHHLLQVGTEADGTYQTPLLADDAYFVQTRDLPLGLGWELYDDFLCLPANICDDPTYVTNHATPVIIDGSDRTTISFTLEVPPGAIISGQVTDEDTGMVLPEIHMNLLDEFNQFAGNTNTDPHGKYYFSGLSDGTYKVYAVGVPEGYSGELYGGDHCQNFDCDLNTSGTSIIISGGVSAPDKDIVLDFSGTRLAGTITRSDTGAPVSSRYAHAGVEIFNENFDYVGGWGTNQAGQFQALIPAGNYYLVAINDWEYHGLINEVWEDIPCFDLCNPWNLDGTLINLPHGTTAVADFELDTGYRLMGSIRVEGTPSGDGQVNIWDSEGLRLLSARNDGSGSWVSSLVPPGTYYATVHGEDFGMESQLYDGISCPQEFCDIHSGTPIVVTDADIGSIDFDLAPLSNDWTISGSIRDTGGHPLNGMIRLFDPLGNPIFEFWTDPFGDFHSDPLANGTYFAMTLYTWGVLDELWENIPCENMICDVTGGTPIIVDGGDVNGIDFVLDPIMGGGRLSGQVKDGTGVPLENVGVVIKNSNGDFLMHIDTQADGTFQGPRLANDSYFVNTDSEPYGLGRELFDDHLCLPAHVCDDPGHVSTQGDAITISDSDRDDINFTLELPPGAVISGQVKDAAIGIVMPDVHMNLLNEFNHFIANTNTDSLGNYYFSGLPDGSYKVYAVGVPEGYTGELYGGDQCHEWNCDLNVSGTLIVVNGGASVPDRDIELDYTGTRLVGTITRSDTHQPVSARYAHMGVDLFSETGDYLGTWATNRAGQYQIDFLDPGNYYLVALNDWDYHGLVNEAWDDIKCWDCNPLGLGATLITVLDGATFVADFELDPGFSLFGTIRVDGILSHLGHANIWDGSGQYVLSGWNNGDGNWRSPPIPAGTYFATAHGESYGLVSELYDGISCPQEYCGVTTGDPIVVTASEVGGIDFNLVPLSDEWTISGSIRDSDGNPVGGAARFFNPFGTIMFTLWVDELGNFQTPPVANGSYFAITMRTDGMLDEAWENLSCVNRVCDKIAGTPIVVDGADVTGIDFVLDPITAGGHLSGLVENSAQTPLPGVGIVIRNSEGSWLIPTATGPDGRFRTSLMANDTYFLHTRNEPYGYGRELYDDVPCPIPSGCGDVNFITQSGTPVVVESSDEYGLDFTLELPEGGLISGRVTDADLDIVLPDVAVTLLDIDHNPMRNTVTNAAGDYYFSGLGDGDYKVLAFGVPEGYTEELYGGDHCPDLSCDLNVSGATININDGAHVNNRNISLDYSGTRLLGTITRGDSGEPVSSQFGIAGVELFNAAGESLDYQPTNSAGQFQFNVPAGDYFLAALVDWDYFRLINEVWDNIKCYQECDPIVVGATLIPVPESHSVVADFELDPETIFSDSFEK